MTALALVALAAVTAIQPCAPYQNTLSTLSGLPCGNPGVAILFHSEAEAKNIDPRVLIAVALATTNGGAQGCGFMTNDPFSPEGRCLPYPNLHEAVRSYTRYISDQYIHNGHNNLDYIGDHEHWPNIGVRKYFSDLLGRPNLPLLYSSSCCGDCNGNRSTEINELIYIITLVICGEDCPPPAETCFRGDADYNGAWHILDLIRDVLSALNPCPGS